MDFKKTLITLTASLTLASTCPAIINSQRVEAKTQYNEKEFLKYAKRFHKVVIIDRTQVYKVHRGYDEAHNRYTKAYVLKPGDVANIRARGIAWGWTIGKKYNYCSLRDAYKFGWFDTYSKHKYIDVSAFKHVKYGTQYYEFTWPQYVRLCKMNLWEATKSEKKAINRYVKSINPKIYPVDSSKSSSKSTNTGSNSKGTYSENGSVHIYKDKNVMLRMNTHAIRPGQNQTIVELTVHNLTNKKMSLRDIISKHLEIQQDANLVDYDLTGTVRPHGVTSAMLYLHPQSKSPITFIFVSGNNAAGMSNYNLPHDYTQPNADNTKQSSASSSNNQSSSNTTSTSNQTNSSSTSSQFTGFPAGAGYMEKAQIIFSLSGDARKQADLQLMKDLGEVDAQGRPEVPIASFEAHLREMYNSAQRASDWIEHGGQTPLQFK